MPLISPAQLYPSGAGRAAYTLLDVRAPIEVARGALPGALTHPLLSDAERHQVGLRYKGAGQDEAVKLGYALTEASLGARIATWRAVAAQGPTAVTCWRGGLRSRLVVQFIGDAPDSCTPTGSRVAQVDGGYKAIRRYLLEQLEPALERYETVVVGGLTGSGKTALLGDLGGRAANVRVLDLEGEAGHRGSAFGALQEPQPAQATFENSVAASLVLGREPYLVLEDESRTIGRLELPDPLYRRLQGSPLVWLEETLEGRIRRIHRDYVLNLSDALGVAEACAQLSRNLLRLSKRLSGPVTEAALGALQGAATSEWRDPEAHRGWIAPLLTDYYDPLYRKGLAKTDRPVVFRGDLEACTAWLIQHSR